MKKFLFIAAALGFAAAAQPASAQMASATARLGAGKSVSVNAVKPDTGGAYLEIVLPEGPQKLEGLGEQFMPLKSGGRDLTLVTADLNGDGVDEIIVRAQVTSTASAILVYQWDAAQKQYFPVQITDSMDQDKPFLFADMSSTVSVDKGGLEVRVTRVDQSGRSAQILERYRWDGDRIRYTEDH